VNLVGLLDNVAPTSDTQSAGDDDDEDDEEKDGGTEAGQDNDHLVLSQTPQHRRRLP